MHSERARGNADKLKQEKFQLVIRKKLFTMRAMKHWKRLPRSDVMSDLKICKTHLDKTLSNQIS